MLDTIETNHAKDQAKAQMESISEMVARLRHCEDCDAGDPTAVEGLCEFDAEYHDEEKIRQDINESPLSLQVRSAWESSPDNFTPSEFNILLCWGGPAVRILGELDEPGQPMTAVLQYQDWATPWTDYYEANDDDLLTYAQQFYFGE